MQHLDKEIYLSVIAAAARVVESTNAHLDDKIEALPHTFKALIDAVQLHKDQLSHQNNQDNQSNN